MKKIGIIGLGFMGGMHFSNYVKMPGVEVVAICDIVKETLEGGFLNAGGNIGGLDLGGVDIDKLKKYRNGMSLIKDPELDIVDICLPTYLHAKYTIAALKAGKNVMCEKPIARTLEDAKAVLKAAKNSDKMLMVGHCIRFWPEYAKAKQIVDSGRYGKVLSATLVRQSPVPTWAWASWILDAKKSGGAALDLHIHDTDFVSYMFGKPKSVTSTGVGKFSGNGGIDHITTIYDYGKGITVVAEGTWCMEATAPFCMSFRIILEKATILFDSGQTPSLTVHTNKGKLLTPKHQQVDGWNVELRHFVSCVKKGASSSEIAPPESSVTSLMITLKEIESAKTRKQVKV